MERIEKPANIQNNGTQRKKNWSLFWVILLSNTQMTMKIHGIHHQTLKIVSGISMKLKQNSRSTT